MGLKEKKSITGKATTDAGKAMAGKIAALATLFCLQIFYAPISYAAQQPSSSQSWTKYFRSLAQSAAKPKQPTPVAPQKAPIFGPGGLLLEPEKTEKFYDVPIEGKLTEKGRLTDEAIKELEQKRKERARQLEKLGYYEAPSQEELERKQRELARITYESLSDKQKESASAEKLQSIRYAVPSTSAVAAGKLTTSEFWEKEQKRVQPSPQPTVVGTKTVGESDVSALRPEDWQIINQQIKQQIKQQYEHPAAQLKKQEPAVKAVLEKDTQHAQQKLEEAHRDYEQKYRDWERAGQEVARVNAQVERFKQEKIRAREVAQQAIEDEKKNLETFREQLASFEKLKELGIAVDANTQQRAEQAVKETLTSLEQRKKELAKAEEIERIVNKKSVEEVLDEALAAGISEVKDLELERRKAVAKLKKAQQIGQESLKAQKQAAKNVEMAENKQQEFERAPWSTQAMYGFSGGVQEIYKFPEEKKEKPAPTVAIPPFNPEPGWTDIGENISNKLWGKNQAKIEERAEQYLQKLTDLLKYTYTPEQGPNPEVLEAIQKHIDYMEKNKFPVSDAYKSQIEDAQKIAEDKQYRKHREELTRAQEAAQIGIQPPKAELPPFNPAQRRSDQTPAEYAQGYLLALLGQYHKAKTPKEKLKVQQAIKAHAAYMKKQKFALAQNPIYAKEDEKLVQSFKTWRDRLPDWLGWPEPSNWRLVKWWRGEKPQKQPGVPQKITAPSTFAPLPRLQAQEGLTPAQNANYYLAELLEHYNGSKELGIAPNPLAASKIKEQVAAMENKGAAYAIEKPNLEALYVLDLIGDAALSKQLSFLGFKDEDLEEKKNLLREEKKERKLYFKQQKKGG